jgi:MoaA/NifB/PqqE/SkfB family radical SAM enzyme
MNDLNDRFCLRPFELLEIHNENHNSDKIRLYCCCPTWIKAPYGHISGSEKNDTELLNKTVDLAWNSDSAIEFRKSVLNGSFSYCHIDRCPYIQNNILPLKKNYGELINQFIENNYKVNNPRVINLCYDRSCNLTCPSCRKHFMFVKKDTDEYQAKIKLNSVILDFIHRSDDYLQINCSGSGDPFASNIFQDFISRIDADKNKNIKILLQTNGVLFTEENWKKIENISKLHHKSILISLDAATEDTYNKIRVGGDWNKLMKNLDFIANLYYDYVLDYVQLDFVVQQQNYHEIPMFIDKARNYGFGVYFSRLLNWQTWSDEIFKKHDICDVDHPEHKRFLSIVNQEYDYERIFWGNINQFRKQ